MDHQFDYTPGGQEPSEAYSDDFVQTFPLHPPKKTKQGYALAALILGIISTFCGSCCYCIFLLSIPLSVIGFILIHISKKENGGVLTGMAKAGLILSIIGLVLCVCYSVLYAMLLIMPFLFDSL